ncbi:MAG: hypothetical protein ACUVQY_06795 [Thermoproteota archaeon]
MVYSVTYPPGPDHGDRWSNRVLRLRNNLPSGCCDSDGVEAVLIIPLMRRGRAPPPPVQNS